MENYLLHCNTSQDVLFYLLYLFTRTIYAKNTVHSQGLVLVNYTVTDFRWHDMQAPVTKCPQPSSYASSQAWPAVSCQERPLLLLKAHKHTDKKVTKFSSYKRKSRRERLQIQRWLNICEFSHLLGSPSSYMTLQPLHLNFLIHIRGKFSFLFLSVHEINILEFFVLNQIPRARIWFRNLKF